MKYLILILAVVPVYVTCSTFLELPELELQDLPVYTREKRQAQYRPYSQAPPQIRQLLQAQQARDPIVHIPAQSPPQLGPSRPIEPQVQSQAQVSSYRPQVQFTNGPQQPSYKSIPAGPAQYRPAGGAQQYNPQYSQQQAAAPGPQYSSRLPPQLQQLVQLQNQLAHPISQPINAGKAIQPQQQRLH